MIIVVIIGHKALLLFIVADDYFPKLFLLVDAFFSRDDFDFSQMKQTDIASS